MGRLGDDISESVPVCADSVAWEQRNRSEVNEKDEKEKENKMDKGCLLFATRYWNAFLLQGTFSGVTT